MNKNLLMELEKCFKENHLDLVTDDIDLITNLNWKSVIKLECLDCGEQFDISVKQLLRPHPERIGRICPRCESEETFLKKLEDMYGSNPYEFLSRFNGYNKPLTVKCKDCGYEWTVRSARNLLMSASLPEGAHPCKQCGIIRNFKKDIDELQKELEKKFGSCDYEFLSADKYSGLYSKQKIKVRCKICGFEFETRAQNLLSPFNGRHYCKGCNSKKPIKK